MSSVCSILPPYLYFAVDFEKIVDQIVKIVGGHRGWGLGFLGRGGMSLWVGYCDGAVRSSERGRNTTLKKKKNFNLNNRNHLKLITKMHIMTHIIRSKITPTPIIL